MTETQLTNLNTKIDGIADAVHGLDRRNERVVIFVDNTNLNFTARRVDSTGNYRLCYNKLIHFLADGRLLKQTRIYYSDFDRNVNLSAEDAQRRNEREGFYQWLKWQGYWLKACTQVDRGDGTIKEKGLDAAIVKDMERLCHQNITDTIILVSGDLDYKEMVQEAQSLYGMRVEVAFFPEFAAKGLQYAATKFINLSEVKETLRRDAPTPSMK
jgi:uncharacterized LabA/DUF88 family protein